MEGITKISPEQLKEKQKEMQRILDREKDQQNHNDISAHVFNRNWIEKLADKKE